MHLLKKVIPIQLKTFLLNKIKNYSIKKFNFIPDYRTKTYQDRLFYCPCCNTRCEFLPLNRKYWNKGMETGYIHSPYLTETINHDFYQCSNCGASDRDRLYALYLENKMQENNKNISLLDIAPSKALNNFFNNYPNVKRRTADLYMDGVDDKIDITNMSLYKDSQFDAFICSHVLEHIDDDQKAMSELYRILKQSGWGILMVPINLGLNEIYENPEIDTENGRWKHFGQNDHVRMYSKKGFIERVEDSGFKVKQLGIDFFGNESFAKYGITNKSVLYIVEK